MSEAPKSNNDNIRVGGWVDSRWFYRSMEMVPGITTWATLLAPIYLSFLSPIGLAYFIIAFDIYWLLKSFRMSIALIASYLQYKQYMQTDWSDRLNQLSDLDKAVADLSDQYRSAVKRANYGKQKLLRHEINRLQQLCEHRTTMLQPDSVYHAIIMASYKESAETIEPSIEAVLKSNYSMKNVIFVMAYEQRGGPEAKAVILDIAKKYQSKFGEFMLVEHPADIPGEIIGKGPNITFAGRRLAEYVDKQKIDPENVIVTTLDADHRVDRQYLSRLTYAYCTNPNRLRSSFQPLAMFFNNIWDVPAPMRVVATGSSFWIMIESGRPHRLRNFASHAQGLQSLLDTDFWSVTSPVEDGHQFWRTYFTYDGDHTVEPLFIPIYQDAVLSGNYRRTFKNQFLQLERWAYGASDFPYVVTNMAKHKTIAFGEKVVQTFRLFEGHYSWATASLILTFAAWAPLLLNPGLSHEALAHQLPIVASRILTIAMIGQFVTIWVSLLLLPPRPQRYRRTRSLMMLLQWILVPVVGIVFGSFAAIDAQTRLLIGKYLGSFRVTEKVVKQ